MLHAGKAGLARRRKRLIEQIVLSPITLIYPAILLFLLFMTYRTARILLSVKHSYCEVTEDRVCGMSTPSPYKSGIPFDINRTDILGIGKTAVSIGGLRSFEALLLNTDNGRIVLFAIEKPADLKKELEQA